MGWDKTKPATNSALVSAEIRDNWTALETSLGGANLLADPTFRVWAAGDSAAPTHYVLAGAGAAVARTGTGLGDTSRKRGAFAAKVTSAAATATLSQDLLPTSAYDDGFDSVYVSCGAWVKCSSASKARIQITDGATTTSSSYHTGGGAFEWLTITGHQISASATKLTFQLSVEATSIAAIISGPTFVLGQVPPADYIPAPVKIDEWVAYIPGTLTTGTAKWRIESFRPGIVLDVHLVVGTAPTGQALIVDVNTFDGAANTSMFSTRPQIAASASRGDGQPDTTYARRCFAANFGSTNTTGGSLTLDIDQVGSGTAGADLWAHIRHMSYARPLEAFLAYNQIN